MEDGINTTVTRVGVDTEENGDLRRDEHDISKDLVN